MTELRVKEYKHTIVQGSERIVKSYLVGDGRTDTYKLFLFLCCTSVKYKTVLPSWC